MEPEGFSGGIWILWNSSELDIQATSMSRWAVHAVITSRTSCPWILSPVYGTSNPTQRVAEVKDVPWLVAGDFNAILTQNEKRGGRRFSSARAMEFSSFLDSCGLLDVGASTGKFTWNNKRNSNGNVRESLDKYLANSRWRTLFPCAEVTNLSYSNSDHRLVLLKNY